MGRETECLCRWGQRSGTVKALLETSELILRGEIRGKIPFPVVERAGVQGDNLTFLYQGEAVSLELGHELAKKWLAILLAPPVTLAKKLGITAESIVWKLGETVDSELETALKTAKQIKGRSSRDVSLIMALIDSKAGLMGALEATAELVSGGAALWLIYPKGKGHAITESDVRSMALATGIVDNKVASISAVHTGLRFVRRRPS